MTYFTDYEGVLFLTLFEDMRWKKVCGEQNPEDFLLDYLDKQPKLWAFFPDEYKVFSGANPCLGWQISYADYWDEELEQDFQKFLALLQPVLLSESNYTIETSGDAFETQKFFCDPDGYMHEEGAWDYYAHDLWHIQRLLKKQTLENDQAFASLSDEEQDTSEFGKLLMCRGKLLADMQQNLYAALDAAKRLQDCRRRERKLIETS